MSSVTKFVPRGTVEPVARLDDFIRMARHELKVLIPFEDWDLPTWSVGSSYVTKSQNRNNCYLHFYRRGARRNADGTMSGSVLDARFGDFAKAYCRYMHALSPNSFAHEVGRLKALQFIEAAFRQLGLVPDMTHCTPTVLNTAVAIAKSGAADAGVNASTHYTYANFIDGIHRFCYDNGFYKAAFQWRHGVGRMLSRTMDPSDNARKWREERLPSPEAYSALAHVFRNAVTFSDLLLSAVSAICCAVPIRPHEVLQLREDCEVRERVTEKAIDHDSAGQHRKSEAYGIRVWPGKCNPPQVKWVPSVMVTVVQEAVQRVRDLCRPAREVAAWYEAHPERLWLPPHLDSLRDTDWIPVIRLREILGMGEMSVNRWLIGNPQVRHRSEGRGRRWVHFEDVERVLLGLMPPRFPWFNGDVTQSYSSTLIVVRRNEIHGHYNTCPCVIGQCTVQTFDDWLSGHDARKRNVFTRWGFTERDGAPIQITPYAFRHWLNTVAQFRGVGELDIAKWSGRQPEQNRAYNHVTSEEILSQVRELLEENSGVGPMFEAAQPERFNTPVSRKDFLDAQIGAAHATDYGICIHDYSLLPCQAHGDCLGCSENVFVKGDRKHRLKIEALLDLAGRQLEQSAQAETEGLWGADRWTQDHLRKIERMRNMLAVHQDPAIRDGTVINPGVAGQDNEIAMAVRDRNARDEAARGTGD